ncbi:MAG: hypothetical protein Q4F54_04810 [Coriobacteriia bacterium]|nr:hypothetical protein [Coriobacteriia bacterium]
MEFKTNESDDSHVITVKASENYKFDKWTVNGAAVTQGKISSSTAFVANFIYVAPPLTDIKVTYKIYNTIFVNGNVQLLKSGSSPDVSVYEEVKVSEQNYQGAKAIELEDNEDSRLDYF